MNQGLNPEDKDKYGLTIIDELRDFIISDIPNKQDDFKNKVARLRNFVEPDISLAPTHPLFVPDIFIKEEVMDNDFNINHFGGITPRNLFFAFDHLYDLIYKDFVSKEVLQFIASVPKTHLQEVLDNVISKNRHLAEGNFIYNEEYGTISTKDYRVMLTIDDGTIDQTNKLQRNRFNLSKRDLLVITSAILLAYIGLIPIEVLRNWLSSKYSRKGALIDIKYIKNKFLHVIFWSPVRDKIIRKISGRDNPKPGLFGKKS